MSQITIQTSTDVNATENGFYSTNSDKNLKNQTSIINKTCNFVQYANQTKTPSPTLNNCSSELQNNLCHIQPQQNYQCYQQNVNKISRIKSIDICRVCGDRPARMHYGVPTCFGCKGFFRRTLKRTKEYTCRYNGNCVVDRYERNSCRFCRFKRCLEVGMDPKAVRPDRDAAGRTHPIRHRRSRNSLNDIADDDNKNETLGASTSDEWIRKLPVDMRTLLMQIMNIELIVAKGDSANDAKHLYPLPFKSLYQILEEPSLLDGKRTEMRYETYQQVQAEEFIAIAHRRLIAVIDMVDHLCSLMDLNLIEDKIAIIKASYAPLAIFCSVAATARSTKDRNKLCLCSYGYVPRGIHRTGEDSYHFSNQLVDRILDELVEPFRAFNFKEQEIILMKAIVTLNPHIRTLSTEASEQVADLRDRIQETLYNVVRESHPKEVASSRFGNLLLFLPNIMLLGNVMYENLRFLQTFDRYHIDPLLNELLNNIEPIEQSVDLIDDVLSDNSDGFIRHSISVTSISSMNSSNCNESLSTNSSYGSTTNMLCINSTDRQIDMYLNDERRASSQSCNTNSINMQASLNSNIQQQLSESDPDYNITLTAENFSGMRQAIVHSMEVDNAAININVNDSTASSDYFSDSSQQQRPNFYIDPTSSCSTGCLSLGSSSGIRMHNVQSNCCVPNCNTSQSSIKTQCCNNINNVTTLEGVHSAIGTKHVFTVEPTKDVYNQCDKNRKMLFISNAKPQHCIVQNTTQSQILQQNKPNNLQNPISNISCNNMINQCCCNNLTPQQQCNNFIMNHSTQIISPSESPPMRSSITQSDGQLDNSNFLYDGTIHELNNFNDDENIRIRMSKSQSYPYVVQAALLNQPMEQQQQEFMLNQQNFYQQESQSINFQNSNKNIQQQIYNFSIQQQQPHQQFQQQQQFLFNNQN